MDHPSGTSYQGRKPGGEPTRLRSTKQSQKDHTLDAARIEEIIRDHLKQVGGEGWLGNAELPTAGELLNPHELTKPLKNLPETFWPSAEAYLRAQYSILRYEGTHPLWCAVDVFRQNPQMKETIETYIYEKVRCTDVNLIRLGSFGRFQFCSLRSTQNIVWDQSQRLTPGSCVALSPVEDNFRSRCLVAVVIGKDDQNLRPHQTPVLDLEFEHPQLLSQLADPSQEWVMIEARSNYYEAVRHVMVGLKQAAQEASPLFKYLAGDVRKVGVVNPCFNIDISAIVQNNGLSMMPVRGNPPEALQMSTGLDDSQLDALQRMLASDLAIVQGPPGTGKTHTSMAALKVLLANQGPKDPPIIVTAQKNDTVDELLKRLLAEDVKVARLGGQTKDERINEHTLPILRRRFLQQKDYGYKNEKQLDFYRAQAKMIIEGAFPDTKVILLDPGYCQSVGLLRSAQVLSLMMRCSSKPPYRTAASNPFAIWLHHRFSPETHTKGFQQPINTKGGSRRIEPADPTGLSENDQNRTRKDIVSSQVVSLGTWCHVPAQPDTNPIDETAVKALLATHDDLHDIPLAHRSFVYRYLQKALVSHSQESLKDVLVKMDIIAKELKIQRWTEDCIAIQASRARVIGCTTTGLTKYRALIAAVGPKTVIIEEAAETREPNIAAGLLPSIRQLILIGDHMQLTPHADVRMLAQSPYNLHVSLFQRLVEHGVPYSTLLVQRRMASPIRQVLNAWYPSLQDHPSVAALPRVPGMGTARTLWLDHTMSESTNQYNSKFNAFEGRLIAAFAHYIVLNGVDPARVTVLTFYAGQKLFVYNVMQRIPELASTDARRGVEVQTVDGFQGKENDIILLSITRSPNGAVGPSAGFLSIANRAIVALSRARLLNAVFGNMANLLAPPGAAAVWGPVRDAMKSVRGSGITMCCVRHGTTFTLAGRASDWKNPTVIGCGASCERALKCGHPCVKKCHPVLTAHVCFRCQVSEKEEMLE